MVYTWQGPKRTDFKKLCHSRQMSGNDLADAYQQFDIVEQEAIEGYDYEKAQFLFNAQCALRNAHSKHATEHYEHELDKYNQDFAAILARKKAANEEKYEQDMREERERLDKRITELEMAQKEELQVLEARWRNSREQQKRQVDDTVSALLGFSQLMAKSGRFDEAISLRDRARTTQKAERHPSLDAVNMDYETQFREALVRHDKAFNEVIEQHESYKILLKARQTVADETAESEARFETAHGPVEVIDAALADTKNTDVVCDVLKHFSPRKKRTQVKNGSRKTTSAKRVR
jgi:uncharacterized protein YihD (DUF1040 family)